MKILTIVIPVFNEAENISVLINALENVLGTTEYDYNYLLVDDGSSDDTLIVIKSLANQNSRIKYISFSRNFGHQNALKAGIDKSNADAVISMDGDMQHPPQLIPELIKNWESGFDVVYTIRRDHLEIPRMKRKTSNLFYNVLNKLSDIELEQGTADFRLLDRKVVDVLRDVEDADLFWRGIVKWAGFKQKGIEYDPAKRHLGKSKYTMKKMIEFALKGLTSFSTKPLTFAIYIGFTCAILSFLYVPYALISLYHGHVLSGWASLIVTIAFFAGIQLMILGIIGMYLGKLFVQSKHRPHYLIGETNL